MKTYISEQDFVKCFSQDVKTENNFSVNGKDFMAEYIGKNSGMQAVYQITIGNTTKKVNITQLKRMLGVTYTRETSRTGETKTTTRFIEKTDSELMETAKRVSEKVNKAVEILNKVANEYRIDAEFLLYGGRKDFDHDGNESWIEVEALILDELKDRQNRVKAERAAKEEQAAKEKADLELQLDAAIQAKDYKEIGRISALLAKF